MSVLDSLKRVKKELLDQKHPFAQEEVQFRQTYAIGYALLICVNGYPSEMAKDKLKKQVSVLDLPVEFKKQAIQTALKAEDETIHKVLQMLSKPEHKYLFMLDLYGLAQQDHKITEREQELLVLFEELLQLSYAEVHFIRGFRLAMLRNDLEVGVKVVQAALEQEVAVPLNTLSYFLVNFVYQERIAQMTLLTGQKRKLKYATLFSGDVIVSKGAELDLNGMEVTFTNNASIIVDGGVLKADGARFVASLDANKTMLSIRNVPQLKLGNVHFFGANIVRALEMNNVQVELDHCTFEKCFDEERGGAVYFTNSEHFVLRNCQFEYNSTLGKGGSMYIAGTEAAHMKSRNFFGFISGGKVQKVKLVMEGCYFKESRAQMSGALHMYDAEISLKDTLFENCTSQAGGAAVDTLNCKFEGSGNTFTKCKAAINEAVVVLAGAKLENEDSFAKFEACEPKNILMK
ncbi:MAG: right-handed parallel beta-helix repeat-containing protein [Lysinibacillus sp.]